MRKLLKFLGIILIGWVCGCLIGGAAYWLIFLITSINLGVAYGLVWGSGIVGIGIAIWLFRRSNADGSQGSG